MSAPHFVVNIESDVMFRAEQVEPVNVVTSGGSRNAYPGDEIPHKDGGVPVRCTFFQWIAVEGGIHHVAVLVRGNPSQREATRAAAVAIRNALNNTHEFVGASGALYRWIECPTMQSLGPDPSSDAVYFVIEARVSQQDETP